VDKSTCNMSIQLFTGAPQRLKNQFFNDYSAIYHPI
jgi:hypothetical protein